MAASSFRYDIYTVGWVCALPIELAAAEKLLDEKHCDPPHDDHDSNLYTLGRINQHNVVIAALPAGYKGNNPAAAVAVRMKARFTSIRFSLLVGVGAGVPSSNNDIRLGDVVISQPHAGHGGVVQYDFGKATPGVFKRTGFLNSPPTVLLQALTRLQARQVTGSVDISAHLSRFGDLPIFARHQAGPDLLFQSSYQHVGGSTCEKCDESYLVKRPAREAEIVIHSGTIASGNQVIRESDTRDRISSELDGALCFEMEAAGLMHSFPCLVIRGICDYADTHKNKGWQAYAAATAAACAKEILSHIPSADVARSSTARTIAQASVDQDVKASTEPMPPCYNTAPSDRSSRLIGYDDCLNDIEAGLRSGIWSEVIITGERGSGKSRVLAKIAEAFTGTHSIFWFSAKTPEAFRNSFNRAALAVRCESDNSNKHRWDSVSEMHLWLSDPAHGKWLVLVDDVSANLGLLQIRNIFPENPSGCLIITNNFSACGNLKGVRRLIPKLPLQKALELFLSIHNHVDDEMVPAVSRLVEALNFHPFGIALTASFLRLHAGQSVDDYYRELQQLKAKTSNHEGIPPEISIPLSIHLKSLENTPSGRLLTLFALIDADRITEKFLRVSQKAVPTRSRENRLSCFTSAEFQPAMTTLRSLSLLEKARDADGGYFKVPKCVAECVLHRLREDSANFQTAVETATALLYSIIASNNINTVGALNNVVPLIGQHYVSLSKHSCARDLCPGQRLQYLGTLVSLYHLRKAASLGFMVCLKRSFRAWLLRNRELSGEDSIDPSLYDEIPPSIPHPNEKTSLWQGTEPEVAGPVSSVLWKNVEGLTIVSAISRAWFTIKEDMLAIARRSAGRYAGAKADDVEDRVDKAAHEAITGVVVEATNDYVRMAAEFGSASGTMELPDLVARAVTYGLDDCADIRAFSEDDLVSIISDAISSDMFSLTWLAGCAWASVLERQKHGMAVVLESLVQQSTSLEALSDTARFTIEQFSKRDIQDYVGEIIEATWEAIDSARCWVAVIIRQGLGLAMMSRMAKSAEPYSHENFGSLRVLVYDSMELLAGAFSVISEYPPNWEWAALMRSITHHYRAAEQGRQLTDVVGITPEVKFRALPKYNEWSGFYHIEHGDG